MNDRHVDPSWPVADSWPPPPAAPSAPRDDQDAPVPWDPPEDARDDATDAAASRAPASEAPAPAWADVRPRRPAGSRDLAGGGADEASRRGADRERAVPFWAAPSSDVTVSWDVPEETEHGPSPAPETAGEAASEAADGGTRPERAPSSPEGTADDRDARPERPDASGPVSADAEAASGGAPAPFREAAAPAGSSPGPSPDVAAEPAESTGPARPGRTPPPAGGPLDEAGAVGATAGGGRSRRRRRPARDDRRSRRDPAEDPAPGEGAAREICLRLLAAAPRTRAQLADALRRKGVPDETAERVLGRLSEVGLIDDEAFARAWVQSRHVGRGLARRALATELRRRGVADETIDEAVETLDPEQEERTARELVARRLPGTRALPLDKRMRRLIGMLARKGYSPGLCYRVVKEALEAEGDELDGWEPPDLDD